MDTYSDWADIPATLKTKNQLRKAGLKPAPGQAPAATKTSGYGPFDLYLVADAVPVRPVSAAMQAALEAARHAQYCRKCGGHTSQVGKVAKRGGLCADCALESAVKSRTLRNIEIATAGNYVVIDTETTGLDDPEIVHIAIVDQHGRIVLDEHVRPLSRIEAAATAVHGHTAESLANCPTWPEIHGRVFDLLDLCSVLAYNMPFDARAIRHTCRLHRTPEPTPVFRDCIMDAFAAEFGEWSNKHRDFRWQTLSTAVQYYGIENEAAHDAAGDAVAAWRVLQCLVGRDVAQTGQVDT